ncbi:MAG: homoserine kinase [Chloroflexi bacterium]|nr:homoserine kinase [Chloroflexota bacterium]MCL5076289.1 homoserine kinase [Chloroflexota bacterium]
MCPRVRVPATAANLGPGFDCFGLALSFFNEVAVESSDQPSLTISGEGSARLPKDETSLAWRTVNAYFKAIGRTTPPLALSLLNRIPLTGGLGSSASVIVGTLVAANELCGHPLIPEQLLDLAYTIEGHPDNVAAALLGGLVITVLDDKRVIALKIQVPPGLRAVLYIPDLAMPTRRARGILPSKIPRQDAIFNLSRAALLVGALYERRFDLLRVAAGDRLHQPYRESLFPAMRRFFRAASEAGALGAYLSGAGSAILALTDKKEEAIAQSLQETGKRYGYPGRALIVDICYNGAEVIIP